jgi:hypothetical protein
MRILSYERENVWSGTFGLNIQDKSPPDHMALHSFIVTALRILTVQFYT